MDEFSKVHKLWTNEILIVFYCLHDYSRWFHLHFSCRFHIFCYSFGISIIFFIQNEMWLHISSLLVAIMRISVCFQKKKKLTVMDHVDILFYAMHKYIKKIIASDIKMVVI